MNAKSSKALRSGACGVAGPAAMAVILALCLPVAAPAAGAEGNELSGKEVVDAGCASCHATGAQGAPRIGDQQAWSKRASRGLAALTENALKGIRKMPPHGGNRNLTDLEITRAITYMVNQSGGKWVEPISRQSPPAARTGEEIVKAQCSKCHQAGVGGAPRIGDRDAWVPRLKQGLDTLIQSAIRGHGGMPARGGMANLTDSEMKGAVIYLFRGPASPGKP
jgi:cytochrome c5